MKADFSLQLRADLSTGDGRRVGVLGVAGEVDATNVGDFEAAVESASAGGLVLDLSELTYCDSAAFAAFDRLVSGKKVAIVLGEKSPARRAAELLGLPTHPSVELARDALLESLS